MKTYRFYTAGQSPALPYALQALEDAGHTLIPQPDDSVTHLLLPVPSFDGDGRIKGGENLQAVLSHLPESVTVVGGNLARCQLTAYPTVDLLADPGYVAENAAITACCAVVMLMEKLPVVITGQKVLVIGWGRIGKSLSRLLRQMGAQVTVAARKSSDRAMLEALGFPAIDTENIDTTPYRATLNTVPQMLVPHCQGEGVFIELASRPGLGGENVIDGRGLPARYAPESSGKLIARRALVLLNKE